MRCFFAVSGPPGGGRSGSAGGNILHRRFQQEGKAPLPRPSAVQPDPAARGQELHHGQGQVTDYTEGRSVSPSF